MISIIIPSLPGYDKLNMQVRRSFLETAINPWNIEVLLQVADRPFAQNVNAGLEQAIGDVLLICNNDVLALPGWAEWANKWHNAIFTFTPRPDCGWFWGMSREIFEKVGLLDEGLFNSYEDYDYYMRAACLGFGREMAPKVYAVHEGGHTLSTFWGRFEDDSTKRTAQCNENRSYMLTKWPGINFNDVPLGYFAEHGVEIMRGWAYAKDSRSR